MKSFLKIIAQFQEREDGLKARGGWKFTGGIFWGEKIRTLEEKTFWRKDDGS